MGNKTSSDKKRGSKRKKDDEQKKEEIKPENEYGRWTKYAKILSKEESVPEMKSEKITNNNDEQILYSLNNNESIDIKLLRIHSKLISSEINKELIESIKLLKKEIFDYRYLIRDQIISCKLQGYGEWICEQCFTQNPSTYNNNKEKDNNEKPKCLKCGMIFIKNEYFCYKSEWKLKWDKEKREKNWTKEQKEAERRKERDEFVKKLNLYNLINEEMNKQELISYHNKLFKKWKIRIQDLIDPLLTSTNKYWIPTEFKIDNNGKVKFISDIVGLSKDNKYLKLYDLFEHILTKMIPSFSWIIGKDLTMIKLKKIVILK